MPITLEQAKALQYGQELLVHGVNNADGTPKRIRVSGSVKTWRRDTGRIRIPVKHGLYDTGYLTNGSWEDGRRINLTLEDVYFEE